MNNICDKKTYSLLANYCKDGLLESVKEILYTTHNIDLCYNEGTYFYFALINGAEGIELLKFLLNYAMITNTVNEKIIDTLIEVQEGLCTDDITTEAKDIIDNFINLADRFKKVIEKRSTNDVLHEQYNDDDTYDEVEDWMDSKLEWCDYLKESDEVEDLPKNIRFGQKTMESIGVSKDDPNYHIKRRLTRKIILKRGHAGDDFWIQWKNDFIDIHACYWNDTRLIYKFIAPDSFVFIEIFSFSVTKGGINTTRINEDIEPNYNYRYKKCKVADDEVTREKCLLLSLDETIRDIFENENR
jgi:hypothetical protein